MAPAPSVGVVWHVATIAGARVSGTSADAFFRGYEVIIPRDAVEAISDEDHESGLKYLETIHKADLPYAKELLEQ